MSSTPNLEALASEVQVARRRLSQLADTLAQLRTQLVPAPAPDAVPVAADPADAANNDDE